MARPSNPEALSIPDIPLVSLVVALGIGLLIGGERERRKRQKQVPSSAGIRTFAVAAVVGAVSFVLGGFVLLGVATAAVAAFAVVAVRSIRAEDPGITTEVALVLTVLAGALAVRDPVIAAAVGVSVAILLAARTPLHHFVASVLTQGEVRDALILAGAALVILPLAPDRAMGPFGAINPHAIWIVVVLVLAVGAAGHVAVRWLGVRFGLPVAGLASGFVSSTATIGAMGARAARTPALLPAAVAGAVLSTVATILQMAMVIGATNAQTLDALAAPLVCAGLTAAAYGAAFTIRALRLPAEDSAAPGQAFSLTGAVIFAATLAVILVAAAALRAQFGETGSIVAAALAGLVDAHATAISAASQVAAGRMTPQDAVVPVLVGLSTNTLSKLILASTSGGRAFAARVAPGLLLVAAAAWIGATWLG